MSGKTWCEEIETLFPNMYFSDDNITEIEDIEEIEDYLFDKING